MSENVAHHWLAVGYVSPKAEEWIKQVGGQIKRLDDPKIILVGLAYNPDGSWQWRKGERQYRVGVEFWNTGELQEGSTGITLQYGNMDGHSVEYSSAEKNYLLLPDEDFDKETGEAKPVTYQEEPEPTTDSMAVLDDFPF